MKIRLLIFTILLFLLTACWPSFGKQTAMTAQENTPTILLTDSQIPTLTITLQETDTPEPTISSANNGWDRYLPRTMAEIIELAMIESELDTMVNNAVYLETAPDYQFPSKVRMIYTGEYREVKDPRKTMINIWLGSFAPQLTANEREEVFEMEFLFFEDGKEFWIPVQKPLIGFMKDELNAGDEVNLFLLFIGANRTENKLDLLFLVNEFN